MARRGLISLGLLLICIIAMLLFKRKKKEGFAAPIVTVSTIAGSGTAGYLDAQGTAARFNYPQSITVDNSGNLYLADLSNNRIRKIDTSGNVTTIAGSGSVGYTDGQGTNATFNNVRAITIDSSGNLYVADLHKIRKIDTSGNVTTIAGSTSGFADGQGAAAKFSQSEGIAVDNSGNLYIADSGNTRIRKIDISGNVTTFAGSVSGFADGQGAAARFSYPQGITIDTS